MCDCGRRFASPCGRTQSTVSTDPADVVLVGLVRRDLDIRLGPVVLLPPSRSPILRKVHPDFSILRSSRS